jgi:hypothetical protein
MESKQGYFCLLLRMVDVSESFGQCQLVSVHEAHRAEGSQPDQGTLWRHMSIKMKLIQSRNKWDTGPRRNAFGAQN